MLVSLLHACDREEPLSVLRDTSRGSSSAADVVALARGLAHSDRTLVAALTSTTLTSDAREGFVVEGGRLVSAGERRAQQAPTSSLVVNVPEDARAVLDVHSSAFAQQAVRVELAHARAVPREHEGGVAVYRDALRATDVLVRSTESAMQVLYLLRDRSASSELTWRVTLGDAIAHVAPMADGSLALRDVRGKVVLQMPCGVAYEADGTAIAVVPRFDRERAEVRWSLATTPRSYPVLVDPVIAIPTWHAPTPPARSNAATAYDAARGELVLFGGFSEDLRALDDTWTWDGTVWTERFVPNPPAARSGHSMAFDAGRGEIVLVGGGSNTAFADTWTWDGITWTRRDTTGLPARHGAALAYDPVRDEVLLFGGRNGVDLGDTWAWNGSDWTQAFPSTSPSARSFHAMACDEARGEIVLYGGGHGATDTWTWDGATWTLRETATTPGARYHHAMAFDAARDEVILIGTWGESGLAATWVWDGTVWARRESSRAPAGRSTPTLAYDALREVVVLFGGREGEDDRRGDTWTWDGSDWTPHDPAPRTGTAMTFDAIRGEVVLFGGLAAESPLNDTWTWDGSRWREHHPSMPPSPRFGHALAFDAARERVLLFGGANATTRLQDTWVWDGSAWSERLPAISPSPRHGHGLAYDAARSEIVLFGGSTTADERGALADTWTWDGSTWSAEAPERRPTERFQFGMAYDPVREEVVIVGGTDRFGIRDETWSWDGDEWTEPRGNRVRGCVGCTLAFGAGRGQLLLFGGEDSFGRRGDTFTRDEFGFHRLLTGEYVSSGPIPRTGHAVAYDAIRNQMVVFGGTTDRAPGETLVLDDARPAGAGCSLDAQCATGFCRDGVCCQSDCGGGVPGDCAVCSGFRGACVTLGSATVCRSGTAPCDAAERCDGVHAACPPDRIAELGAPCRAAVSDCDAAETCDGETLGCPDDAARPVGSPCGGTPTSACDARDLCEGDVGATATCAPRFAEAGVPCREASCTNGTETASAVCSGTSASCPPLATFWCNVYACGEDACRTTCSEDAHCAPGHFCAGGTCEPLRALGAACDDALACGSGVCAANVCCNRACTGACESCVERGRVGACVAITDTPECRIPCANDGACAPSQFCSAGECSADLDVGGACTSGAQCLSARCVELVCRECAVDAHCDAGEQCVEHACRPFEEDAGADGGEPDAGTDERGRGGCASHPAHARTPAWMMLLGAVSLACRRRRSDARTSPSPRTGRHVLRS